MKIDDDWMLIVSCGIHNHPAISYEEGHSFLGRLSAEETEMVVDMSTNLVKPRNILSTLKERNRSNVSTMNTIYNARQKHRVAEKAGMSEMQYLMSNLSKHKYVFLHRKDMITEELTDLFFAHPKSLEMLHAFPHVLLMDCTYKTNWFRMPLLEIVGMTSTKMTFCVVFVFLQHEKEENYTWALSCLRSTMDPCVMPMVTVTNRELALMNSLSVVFPSPQSISLLCRWHIERNILAKCRNKFDNEETWKLFFVMWNALVTSKTEPEYDSNLYIMESRFFHYAAALTYIKANWLSSYKEKFVSAWTDKCLHFGNTTTNRVESQHAKLKRYLGTSQGSFDTIWPTIHNLLEGQFTTIKASLEKSIQFVQHRFTSKIFAELRGFVSADALEEILKELKRSTIFGENMHACQCIVRLTHGLPCAHEISSYSNSNCSILLSSIDSFWKKLDFTPCTTLDDDDIDGAVEVEMFTQQFQQKRGYEKLSFLRKLREIINPSTTGLLEPDVNTKTRGRPLSNKKMNASTRRDPSAFEYVEASLPTTGVPHRHSCSYVPDGPSAKGGRSQLQKT